MHADPWLDRVALACLQCRRRHIKCDASQPFCRRCQRDGKECTYEASRRGGLDKAALTRARVKRQEASALSTVHCRNGIEAAISRSVCSQQVFGRPSSNYVEAKAHPLYLYYEYFWRPFPMVLPHQFLRLRLDRKHDHGLEALIAVMQWIGSLYTSSPSSEQFYETASRILEEPISTPFNVQALALMAIAQHHCDDRDIARTTLDRAIVIALQLGMNKQEYARQFGEGDAVLEESWRRAYYILYSIDQEFSVVSRILNFVMANVANTVDLPCDDSVYESGTIPPPSTWKDYKQGDLEEVEHVFSSLTYAHDLRTFVASVTTKLLQGGRLDEDLIKSVDVKIASWQALLPACKKDPLRLGGTIDEVMWQAHASVAILMIIHRPVSALAYNVDELTTKTFMSLGPVFPVNPARQPTHTARTLKALNYYADILAIACAREKHSVFSMCITAQMATIQVSACKYFLDKDAVSLGRNRLSLFLGHLIGMGRYWPLGRKMAKEVKAIARLAFEHDRGSLDGIVAEDIGGGDDGVPCSEGILDSAETHDSLGIAMPAD